MFAFQHRLVIRQRLTFSPPGSLPQVAARVECDAEDPCFEVLHFVQLVLMPPAFDEGLLKSIAGVLQIPDQVIQRPQQLGLARGEDFLQSSPVRRPAWRSCSSARTLVTQRLFTNLDEPDRPADSHRTPVLAENLHGFST